MNKYDEYIEDMLAQNKLRPPRGFMWCEKLTPEEFEEVEGLGLLSVKERTEGGLILVGKSEESENVLAQLYIVRAVGEDPHEWDIRWHVRTEIWVNRHKPGRIVLPHTFAEQKIGVGTVIAARNMAGAELGAGAHFTQIKYDEVIAIGTPLEEEGGPDMYPGPGWVTVETDPIDTFDEGMGLYVGEGDVYRDGWVKWGTVVDLPRNDTVGCVEIGDRVAFYLHITTGATEYVEFENGKYRCMPMEDILLCQKH